MSPFTFTLFLCPYLYPSLSILIALSFSPCLSSLTMSKSIVYLTIPLCLCLSLSIFISPFISLSLSRLVRIGYGYNHSIFSRLGRGCWFEYPFHLSLTLIFPSFFMSLNLPLSNGKASDRMTVSCFLSSGQLAVSPLPKISENITNIFILYCYIYT